MLGRLLFAGIALALLAPAVEAIPAHYTVAQLYHSKWTIQDGAPAGIQAMVQTRDGFLWLGAANGLFRFDGVQFERFTGAGGIPLPARDIYSLHASSDGGLWIGYHFGGVSYLRGGQLVNYGLAEGLPAASIVTLATTSDGESWAGTSRGLYRLVQGQWRLLGTDWNIPERYVFALLEDRNRTLWMISESKVFYLRRGARRFERLPVTFETELETAGVATRPDGTVALCTRENYGVLKLVVPSDPQTYVADWDHRQGIPAAQGACAFDRDGHLWVGSEEGGGRFLSEVAITGGARENLDRYRSDLTPLSGPAVNRVLEDREGNIWFATSTGLDRFRAPAFLRIPLKGGAPTFGLASAGNRGIWVTGGGGHVYRVHQGRIEEQIHREGFSSIDMTVLGASRSGELWFGAGNEILRRTSTGQLLASVRPPVSTGREWDNILAIAPDVRGETWVSVPRVGVYRVVGGEWMLTRGRADHTETATVLFADADNRVWAGYIDGAVAINDGERVITLVDGKSTSLGTVFAFAQQRDMTWIGSERGLWITDGTRIRAVIGRNGAFVGVAGIVPTDTGDLWLNTSDGVVHISAAEVAQTLNDPGHRVRYQMLDYLDGAPSDAAYSPPYPKAVEDSDGRLWFAGTNGVAWLDPSHTPHNDVVPTVVVKSILADGVRHALDPGPAPKLPARTHNLQISYTAPSLTMSERVKFRYRLVDEDADWQDVGTRREAYFTDLPPGSHRFQVIAANNDGVWNETGASVAFFIPPTFVQTIWFRLIWVCAIAAAIGLLFVLRLRSLKSRMRLRMEEREHIARELHDTFLQAVQGLMLRFQTAMERIPSGEPSRAMMEDALDRADHVIADGRDAVSNLRSSSNDTGDLCEDLEETGTRLAQESGIDFTCTEEGQRRALRPDARLESQRLAIEALTNAFHHSGGARVELKVIYARKIFSLKISDDGRGFDPDRSHVGHWGLIGMRERASRMRGRLLIESGRQGTCVTLEIPARVAYAPIYRF
jgi:signal transduction histidine kinase/ligand-binding sensor domain-containing protein